MAEKTKMAERADWEIREDSDDYLITSDDIITEIKVFPQTGKPYLTLIGLFAMANRIGLECEVSVEDTGKSYRGSAVGKDANGKTRYAGHEEFKNGDRDTHAYAKCWSKTQRNFFKACLYGDEIVKEAFAKFEVENKTPQPQRQRQQSKATPKPQRQESDWAKGMREAQEAKPETNGNDADRIRKRCFALFGEHKETLGGDDFWDRVRARFGVKSRSTMTYKNWQACLDMIKEEVVKADPEVRF